DPLSRNSASRGNLSSKGMGSGRGNAETGFIRSVDEAVHRFYTTVVVHLDKPAGRRTAAQHDAPPATAAAG
ncbi:hypothetical protein GA0115238_110628, partial [Streptomyces sp. di50b]